MPGFFDSKLPQMPAHASSQTFCAVVTCATLSVTVAPPAGLAAGAAAGAAVGFATAAVGAAAAAVGAAGAVVGAAGGAGAVVGAAGGALGAQATPTIVSPMNCNSCRRFIPLMVVPLPGRESFVAPVPRWPTLVEQPGGCFVRPADATRPCPPHRASRLRWMSS